MGHPSDGEAWKVLDRFDADFASDVRNVCFRLVIDDFDPFSTICYIFTIICGRSSTGEFLTYFYCIFTIIGVVTFTICFSLQEKYKEEVVKQHGEGFNWEDKPIDDQATYASKGRKAHER
jgi:hypothetical protein